MDLGFWFDVISVCLNIVDTLKESSQSHMPLAAYTRADTSNTTSN